MPRSGRAGESQRCNSPQSYPQSVENSGPRVGRRLFLTAVGVAALTAACGGGNGGGALGTDGQDLGGSGTTAPPGTVPPATAPPTTATPAPTGPADFVPRGPATANRVALTFHTDGDLTIADQLLRTLRQRGVPMTSFLVGEWLAANPDWAKRLLDDGHELANHTYTHPTFSTLTPDAMRDEITRTRDLLDRLTGSPGAYFRPSGTANGVDSPSADTLAAAGTAGYRTVLGYDVDPLDYQSPAPEVIAQRTLAAAHPGAVVSLHFGYPNTVAALPAILDGLAQRGLTPVTASALLGR